MSLLAWIFLGFASGFIASNIIDKSGDGFVLDIGLSIAGAVLGGWLLTISGMSSVTELNLYEIVVAVVGAMVVLTSYHLLVRRPRRSSDRSVDGETLSGRLEILPPPIRSAVVGNAAQGFSAMASWRLPRHATVPKRDPTPAVSPMASAPQNVTRIAPIVTLAPPTRAANAPRIARNTSEVPETMGISLDSGTMATANSGMAAPTAKLAAEVNAA